MINFLIFSNVKKKKLLHNHFFRKFIKNAKYLQKIELMNKKALMIKYDIEKYIKNHYQIFFSLDL